MITSLEMPLPLSIKWTPKKTLSTPLTPKDPKLSSRVGDSVSSVFSRALSRETSAPLKAAVTEDNLLGISLKAYGTYGIELGNKIHACLHPSGFGLQYVPQNPSDPTSQGVITVSDNNTITAQKLKELLLPLTEPSEPWYATVQSGRDKHGRLQITFSHIISSISQEMAQMEQILADTMVKVARQFFNPRRDKDDESGLWYPHEYEEFLRSQRCLEMHPSFYNGAADDKYWVQTGPFAFKLRDKEPASKALRSFLLGPTVLDCGNAVDAAFYYALLRVLGKFKFNAIFSSGGPFCLSIGSRGQSFPLLCLFTPPQQNQDVGKVGKRLLKKGDACYVEGIPLDRVKHPGEFSQGHHVVYIGNNSAGVQLFMGHGVGPITEEELKKFLLKEYNKERTSRDIAFIASSRTPGLYDAGSCSLLNTHYTFPESSFSLCEFLDTETRRFDLAKIRLLKQCRDSDALLTMESIARFEK